MKTILSFISTFALTSTLVFAQTYPAYEYRSAENPHYWKNRKPYEGYWQQDVDYKIKAQIDDKTDIVTAEEELTYYNNSPDTLRFVYFHLYQNAFIKGGYLEKLNLANDFKQKFGKYEAEGLGTSIQSIKINGKDALFSLDVSIMKVELSEPIFPNSSVTFNINFKTYFDDGGNQRRRMKLFKDNWGNKHYDAVHWYPRICVYDRKFGWETDQHLGKEFYGDFGSYEVELTLPKNFVVDATGMLQNKNEVLPDDLRQKLDVKNFKDKAWDSPPSVVIAPDGTTKTWKYKSVNTHDFAWTTDPTYRIGEKEITLSNGEKVLCVSLAQEPHAKGWQDAADFCAKVIEVYSRDIGNYAYPKMIVADARDGMEYPMLTLDGGSSPGYYGLIAHEVGHNWFFGMVGNNETYRASLDEGFTQFLTNWCMTSLFGEFKPTKKDPYPVSRMDQTIYRGYIRGAINNDDMPLNTHSDDFNSALGHGGGYGNVYYKTATMLYNLQYVLGDTLFLAAMQYYFNQWKMAHPYFEDFRNSIINFTHVDLNWFFDQWLETTKKTDYAVWGVKKTGEFKRDTTPLPPNIDVMGRRQLHEYQVTFTRKGEMQMPLDFTVITKKKLSNFDSTWTHYSVYEYHIPNTYFVKKTNATVLPMWKGWGKLNQTYNAKIYLGGREKIENVIIDPTYRLADIYQLDNAYKTPIDFSFDKGKSKPYNRKAYYMRWRPDVWYNSVDGVKAGLHFNGQYLQRHHIFSATVWYNTIAGSSMDNGAQRPIDFTFNYQTAIAKNYTMYFQAKQLDGLSALKYGFEIKWKQRVFNIYYKGFIREKVADLDYLLYTSQWNPNMRNSSLNLDGTKNYTYTKGSGTYSVGLRASFFSDYDYSSYWVKWLNNHQLWKFDLRSNVLVQMMGGSNIAPESKLYAAGANPEEMMDNKFIRSQAFVPTNWLGYGNNVNHFQAGGGLNIRGYAGYVLPQNVANTQVQMFAGTSGGVLNVELDFDKLIPLRPRKISQYIHIDTYLFGDVGFIANDFKAGEFGLTQNESVTSNLLASAGAGLAFTIKRWGNMDEVKPLTIRFDMPLFINNTPFVDGQFVKFRWVVGVNRAF